MKHELVVYGRSVCHLCQDMIEQLEDLQPEYGYNLKIIDINGEPELEAEFGTKVPVLMAGNREICHYTLDLEALKGILGDKPA